MQANSSHPPSGSPETSAESSSNVDVRLCEDDHNSLSTSHNDDATSSHDGSGTSTSCTSKKDDEIAKQQQRVACTRCAALFLVLATAVAAGVTTYLLTSKDHEQILQYQIDEVSKEVLATATDYFNDITNHLQDMTISMTALAQSSSQNNTVTLSSSWPWPHYYTLTNFATSFGPTYLDSLGAELISWSPLLKKQIQNIEWGNYVAEHASEWLPQSMADQVPAVIFTSTLEGKTVPQTGDGPFAPVWQIAVPLEKDDASLIDTSVVNYNALSNDIFASSLDVMMTLNDAVLTPIFDATSIYGASVQNKEPTSLMMTPLHATTTTEQPSADHETVGVVVAVLPWTLFFKDILSPAQPVMYVMVQQEAACGEAMTFTMEIYGETCTYVGPGVPHDEKASVGYGTELKVGLPGLDEPEPGRCYLTITVYPSQEGLADMGTTDNTAIIWTVIVVFVILFAGFIFFAYDYSVQRRMMKTRNSAAKTNAVLASLFPVEVRDRLLGKKSKDGTKISNLGDASNDNFPLNVSLLPESTKYRLSQYLAAENEGAGAAAVGGGGTPTDEKVKEVMAGIDMHDTKPIAEFFPHTTVLFADISGFTAWSSVREPSQVFVLLETVYHAFDNIAKRRKVFKVETVGDCYVAVAGLPEARKDHAMIMAKFAKECLSKFNELSKQLEISLGPDTGDLAMRAGLHSGPVTAGVLRGDRSRFQLFGETVNVAARVEATGERNRVHLSVDTARLLVDAGKEHWLMKRADIVTAKGKGELQTYWLVAPGFVENDKAGAVDPKSANRVGMSLDQLEASLPPKIQRLVGWNVEILKKLLQQIIAHRNAVSNKANCEVQLSRMEKEMDGRKQLIKEVTEIIALPRFDATAHQNQESPSKIKISEEVVKELKFYVCSIAAMHRDNYFHNFEHASHVTMSVSKLLSRIIAPSEIMDQGGSNLASALHDHTFGITSDPLSHFSMVLSALIHDTDHLGVSNAQLVKEKHQIAAFYKGKSVAEQNSVILAWTKLMDPSFYHLRRIIYSTPAELQRFRQIVVNNVLATDLFDKELQTIRKNRWEKAFAATETEAATEEAINRKATIVMEHLIQASDVSHTMQHWHIYHKWNERLFAEMVTAYNHGRLSFDPAAPDAWFKGELGFFDNYIIPLAKKLKDCGVFGVSCDEYLNYALENRREWASKGEKVVALYVDKYCKPKKE